MKREIKCPNCGSVFDVTGEVKGQLKLGDFFG